MTVTEEFVSWARKLPADGVPAPVRRRAALQLLDGLGVALAASRVSAVPFATTAATMFGTADESSVIGLPARTSAAAAAFANGVLMHGLDYDDTHTAGLVHATAVTAPTALAVGEQRGRSGADVLDALVLGYELLGRLGAAAPHGFHARGFHATSVCGAISSALVASVLSDASEDATVQALGIAGSFAFGSLEFLATGASTKQLHPGWASLAGVVAGRLAADGATGPSTVLDGDRGLYALFTDMAPDLASITAGLGTVWQTDGIAMKPYPACHLMHAALDAAATLRPTLDPGQVRAVRVRLPTESIPIVAAPAPTKIRPRTSYEAKFSVQWSVAAMLLDGVISIDSYDASRLGRPDVLRLSERVTVTPADFGVPAAEAPGDVLVELEDGRERHGVTAPAGAAGLEDRVLAKFRANVTEGPADDLIDAVTNLDAAPDLVRLMALLRSAGRP